MLEKRYKPYIPFSLAKLLKKKKLLGINAFNKFMLLRAEERYGNADGFFTVEEQNLAFGELYEAGNGQNVRFDTSDQRLVLGLRLAF